MELIKEYGMYRGIGFPDTVREFVLGRERKGMFLRFAEMIRFPTLVLPFLLSLVILNGKTHGQSGNNDLTYPATSQCYPKLPLASTACGELPNCAKALLSGFPIDIANGDFHRGAPNNIFKLPRAAFVGDCIVTVDVIDGPGSTLGSWVQVLALANTLNAACTYYMLDRRGGPGAFTGGTLLAGRSNRLSITTARYAGVGNSSEVATV
ncbi:MAG: hypothetical protein LQ339_003896 [Xanthoria mediterranea]|nr:MAG: hypothetical protein LQ339_003896 [Xanthoria mediterranea]